MGAVIHGPFLLADVLSSDTLSDDWTMSCDVSIGDAIQDGGVTNNSKPNSHMTNRGFTGREAF